MLHLNKWNSHEWKQAIYNEEHFQQKCGMRSGGLLHSLPDNGGTLLRVSSPQSQFWSDSSDNILHDLHIGNGDNNNNKQLHRSIGPSDDNVQKLTLKVPLKNM